MPKTPGTQHLDTAVSLTIRTNLAALMTSNELGSSTDDLTLSLSRVATGLRITKAGDDAAALGVATNLETVSKSTSQAIRNANDAISIIQTAEGAQSEVIDLLQRIRALAVQSASETLANSERSYIQDEVNSLQLEISRIANVTEFNGIALSNGSLTNDQLSVQVGINNDTASQITIDLGDLRTSTLIGGTGSSIFIDVSTASLAQSNIAGIDQTLDSVNAYRADLGAVQNRLDSALRNAQVFLESKESARSNMQDTDYASETSEMTKYQIIQQAGIAALSQAKNMTTSALSLLI